MTVASLFLLAAAPSPQVPSDSNGGKTLASGNDGTTVVSCSYMPSPDCTKEARSAKFTGTVLVEATVKPDGKITGVRITKSPRLGLDEAVLKMMKTWKCQPATHDGKPVATKARFEISFNCWRD